MAEYIINPYDQGINADMAGFAKQAKSSTEKSPETIRGETHEFVRQFSTPPAVTSQAEGDPEYGNYLASLVSEPQESSLLDTGILSIGDREEKAMPEENLGQDDFEAKRQEMEETVTSRPMFKLAKERFEKGDSQGAIDAVIAKKKEDVDNSNLSEKEKEKAKKDYDMFNGSPDTWLLDFGLALMACDSPYLGTCLGKAGMTAQKGARERDKAKTDKELLKLKKEGLEVDKLTAQAKLLKAGKGDYEIKTMSYLHPETGERLIGQVRRDKDTGNIDVIRDGKVAYSPDPEGAWTVNTSAESKYNEKSLNKFKDEMRARQIGTDKFLGRAASQLAYVTSDATLPQSEFVREGYINLEAIKESVTSVAKDLGVDVDADFAKKLNKDPSYLEKLMGKEEDYSPEMKQYIDRVGGFENFKAINLSMAIDLAASKGTTGRALSDKDMVNFLTQVGAQAKTRQGYIATVKNLIKNTQDDFLVDLREYNSATMGDKAPEANYYNKFFAQRYSDPFYKERWGGALYNMFTPTTAPAAPAPAKPAAGTNPYAQFDPVKTQ